MVTRASSDSSGRYREGEKGPGSVPLGNTVRMAGEEDEIVIGDCLTREQAEQVITVLAQEGALQDLLVEAQIRSDQHRQNYVKLKGEHERLIHQLKVMETEMAKLETEKLELETEIRSDNKK